MIPTERKQQALRKTVGKIFRKRGGGFWDENKTLKLVKFDKNEDLSKETKDFSPDDF